MQNAVPRLVVLVATLAALMATPRTTPANMLVNGSFEDSPAGLGLTTTPGWAITAGNIDIQPLPIDQAPGQGTKFLELVGTCPGTATIEQSFATTPGQEYLFRGWLSHHPGVPRGNADVFLDGVFFVELEHLGRVSDADMAWQPFAYSFVATDLATTLTITDTTALYACGGLNLDGLSITPVPEPSTLALAGVAGLVLAGYVRRRRAAA